MENKQMAKYQRGKIYSIRSYQTNEVYIGSTINSLSKRLGEHKTPKNKCISTNITKYNDVYIELIENFPCNSRIELNKREGEIIRETECINKNIAGRNKKEWLEDNKEHVIEYQSKYKENNEEKIKNQKKEHYQLNKYIIKQKSMNYLNKNREEINRKRRESRKLKKEEIKKYI